MNLAISKEGLIVSAATIITVASFIAPNVGLTPTWSAAAAELPSNVWEAVWGSLQFFVGMAAFSIEGVPAVFSLVWDILILFIFVYAIQMVRGN